MIQKAERNAFRDKLLEWFENNARRLPWRDKPNWYKTFLSEIMLQQTQVNQVIPYFYKFYEKYPDISALAEASEQEILTLWAGLGYYSRARNLRNAALKLVNEFSAEFPLNIKDALSLPGIGQYTAHAILSIAFNQPFAVVDGNVKRAISRIIALNKDISSVAGFKKITSVSELLLDKKFPSKYNEALMELGATICTINNPHCSDCPVNAYCRAYKKNSVHKYPLKSPRRKKKDIFFYAFIIEEDGRFLITKRAAKGLLASMWEFPSIEKPDNTLTKKELSELIKRRFGMKARIVQIHSCIKHQYTHLSACYIPIRLNGKIIVFNKEYFPDHQWIKAAEFSHYPIHTAHKKIVEQLQIFRNTDRPYSREKPDDSTENRQQ